VYLEDLEGAERLAARLARHVGSCAVRALGQRMLSQTSMARGRPRLAMAWLRAAGPCQPAATLELRIAYATLPFLRPDPAELARLRHTLESPARAGSRKPGWKTRRRLTAAMREYCLVSCVPGGDTQADGGAPHHSRTGHTGRLASLKGSLPDWRWRMADRSAGAA
jgi:hypothetical protein